MRFGKESGESGIELRVWQERAAGPLIQNGAGQHGGRNAASQRKESPSRLARPAGQTTAPNVMLVHPPPTSCNPRSSRAILGNFADRDVFCTGSETGGGGLARASLVQHAIKRRAGPMDRPSSLSMKPRPRVCFPSTGHLRASYLSMINLPRLTSSPATSLTR